MRFSVIIIFLMLLCAVSFSEEIELVRAKYNVAECYINATVEAVDAVDSCAQKHDVNVTDLSSYKTLLESDRSALKAATTSYEFESAWDEAKKHMNQTREAIRDANSSLSGTNLSIGLAKLCYAGKALKTYTKGIGCVLRESFAGFAKVAILAFYDASIKRADTILYNSKLGGLQTTDMETALTYAKSLRPELVSALETKNQAKFRDVRLRYGRSAIRFYSEYATALADWAEPLVKSSNNYNKAEILNRLSTIRSYVSTVDGRCPAVYTIGDAVSYEQDNKQCWEDLKKAEAESKAVVALYRSGRPVLIGGEGTLHAEGTGNVSIFGSASVNATGSGDLFVTDFKGDSTVSIDVSGKTQPDGSTRYSGFSDAKITGSLIHVRISGDISVDAAGKGLVKMQGNGTFYATPGLGTEGDYSEVGK